jgi:hypothetical protein
MRRSLIIVTALVFAVLAIIASQSSLANNEVDMPVLLPPITDGVTPLVPQELKQWNRYKSKALKENPGAVEEPPVMGTPKLDILARQGLNNAYQRRYGVPPPGCMPTRWMLYKMR